MKSKKIQYPILIFLFLLAGCSNGDIKEIVNSSIFIPLESSGGHYPTPINTAVTIELQTNKSTSNLAFIIQNNPYKGTLIQSLTEKNKFTYTPNLNYNGPDSFKFYVTDGQSSSNVSEITLFVGENLVAFDKTVVTQEDTYKDIILQVNNPNLASLVFNVNQPSNGTVVQISGSTWRYTPNVNFNGNDSFTFYASAPGFINSNTSTVSITIGPENDPPVTLPRTITTNEDSSVNITLNASDPENDPLIFSIKTAPSNGICDLSGSTVTYTPKKDFNGTDTFTYSAYDGSNDSNSSTVTVTVNPVHDTPFTRNQLIVVKNYSASQGTLDFDFNLDNPDGGELIYNFTAVSHGTLSQNSGKNWKYIAEQNYFGQFEFIYTVTDSSGAISNNNNPSKVSVNVVPANVIYVRKDALAGGNGTSWDTAFNEVSDAMNTAADPGTEIWVASGEYSSNNITIKNGISILGGFDGTEFNPNSRNISNPATILNAGSSIHALKGYTIGAVTIDRITIKNGKANGFGESYFGGGIFIKNSSNITIKNCIFDSNQAGKGGAVYLENTANAQLIDNAFSYNTASASGGAIYFASVSNSKISYTSGRGNISHNVSSGDGGAVFIDQNSGTGVPVILENYELLHNTSGGNGGAICNNGNSLINNCIVTDNIANNFGGGIADSTGTSIIQSSTISNNKAGIGGGGVYTLSLTLTTLTIKDSVISGNSIKDDVTTPFHGGGIYNDRINGLLLNNLNITNHLNKITYGGGIYSTGTVQISASTISGNEVLENGGAVYSTGYCKIDGNSTLNSNKASRYGGAIFNYLGSRLEVYDSTLSLNKTENTEQDKESLGGAICGYKHIYLLLNNVIFHSNYAKSKSGAKGGAICDLHVSSFTSIIDSSFTSNSTKFDSDSTSLWTAIDYSGGAIYQYNSISSATYTISGTSFTCNSSLNKGGAIYHYNSKGDAQFKIEISLFASNYSQNIYDTTVLCSGGAIHLENTQSTPTYSILNSHFKQNQTTDSGAAIYSDSASTILIDESLFQANSGIYKSIGTQFGVDGNGNPIYSYDNVLYSNGIFYNKNKANFTNSVFAGNYNIISGGAIYNALTGNLSAINCLIMKNNSSITNGAGLFNEGTASITNCTIEDNSSSSGSGLYNTSTGAVTILNSIIWDTINNSGTLDAKYTCASPILTGDGNISTNPSFIPVSPITAIKIFDYSIGYYFLKQTATKSPCIDTGDPDPFHIPAEITGKTTDKDKDIIDGDPIDMGYHYKLWL